MRNMFKLSKNERIENLGDKGLHIIQSKNYNNFSVDSLLLAKFVRLKNYEKIIDLGTGSGIIPLLLFDKRKGLSIYGIEIQEELSHIAKRSVELNNLQNYITIICVDYRNIKKIFKDGNFDVVVSNPPYISVGHGIINSVNSKAIARHEITGNLEDLISMSNYLLKNKGRIYLVYKSSKLIKLITTLKKHNIEPKTIRFIHHQPEKVSDLVLLEGVKSGKGELKIENPLFIKS